MLIAVVDDDYRMLQSLDDLLQAEGYRTLLCASAEHFLGQPARQAVDFIISDIALPAMSGIELLRTLRGQASLPPAILITGRNERHFEEDARDLGVLRLFSKPIDSGELLTTLRAALSDSQ